MPSRSASEDTNIRTKSFKLSCFSAAVKKILSNCSTREQSADAITCLQTTE